MGGYQKNTCSTKYAAKSKEKSLLWMTLRNSLHRNYRYVHVLCPQKVELAAYKLKYVLKFDLYIGPELGL
jgi:hypothetical protein